MTLLTDDDLAREQARARVKAGAAIASPLRGLALGDLAVPADQVMIARMMGMAQAIGTMCATLGDLGRIMSDAQVAMARALEATHQDADRANLARMCEQVTGKEPTDV